MQPAPQKNNLDFGQAIQLAIDIVPGLKNDLEIIKKKRINGARDMNGIGRTALDIPEPCLPIVYAYFPDLNSPDREINARAWLRFMKSPHSEIFRCNAKL